MPGLKEACKRSFCFVAIPGKTPVAAHSQPDEELAQYVILYKVVSHQHAVLIMIFPTESDDLCALLEPVKKVAYQAGRKIMEIYDQGFDVEQKADNTPLTEADLAAHRAIMAGLTARAAGFVRRIPPHHLCRTRELATLLVGRSPGRHAGIYQPQWGVHREYCPDR